MRVSVPSPPLATQTLFGPAPIPSGAVPTLIVCTTFALAGSMRSTLLARPHDTQIEPNAKTTPRGEAPTSIVLATEPSTICATVLSSVLATHTAPPPTAMPLGLVPTLIG